MKKQNRKSGAFTIMKKELARFFGDKRLVVSILMPGVLIYCMYTFMGSAMGDMFGVDEEYTPTVQTVCLPDSVGALLEGVGMEVSLAEGEEEAKAAVTAQELDLLLVFPDGFDQAVAVYDASFDVPAPQVEIFYNSASTESQSAYQTVITLLDTYEASMTNKFDVNRDGDFDLATQEDSVGQYFAMLLPMLLMIFLYSGCSSTAPESIAGEKERGTIATMLITPIRRSDIALGKILALAVLAMLSGASSAIGTILSLPKLMGGVSDEFSASIYGVKDYLLLAAVVFSTVLVLVTLISILSAFAKTVKEAQTYSMPLMIVTMVLGITAMFGGGASQELPIYCLPLYNSVQCMSGIFSFSMLPGSVAVTVVVNGAVTLVGVFLLAKMFNSEKIIFSR